MFGSRGLRQTDFVHDVAADTGLFLEQQADDVYAHRVGERFGNRGERLFCGSVAGGGNGLGSGCLSGGAGGVPLRRALAVAETTLMPLQSLRLVRALT